MRYKFWKQDHFAPRKSFHLLIVRLKKSRHLVNIVVAATFTVGFLVTLFRTGRMVNGLMVHRDYQAVKISVNEKLGKVGHKLYNKKGEVVILYSNQRSGSTFVGEFFNKNPNAFYLFEPLFSFSPICDFLYEERLKVLVNISICDFRDVPRAYLKAHAVNHYDDSAAKCLRNNICFYPNQDRITEKYASLCKATNSRQSILNPNGGLGFSLKKLQYKNFDPKSKTCGLPLNTTLVSGLCAASELVAFKVLRICDLSRLESVYKTLTLLGNDVHVIHLVRDPRAIVNSCLDTEMKLDNVEMKSSTLCGRLEKNLDYVDQQMQSTDNGSIRGIVTDGRYLRVRHEDISQDPLKAGEEIYKFIGLDWSERVEEWLNYSSIDPRSRIKEYSEILRTHKLLPKKRAEINAKLKDLLIKRKSKYGTVRDSKSVPNKWRLSLSMKTVSLIQKHCSKVMDRLGYKLVKNVKELCNLNSDLW